MSHFYVSDWKIVGLTGVTHEQAEAIVNALDDADVSIRLACGRPGLPENTSVQFAIHPRDMEKLGTVMGKLGIDYGNPPRLKLAPSAKVS